MKLRVFLLPLALVGALSSMALPPGIQAAVPVTVKLPKKLQKGAFDLNKASFDQLNTLDFMNPSRARDVVDGRPWKSVDDFLNRKDFWDVGDLKALKKGLETGYLYLK
ncbi:hypothetical protein [Anthocerotibacter panamensis]|uniref:hypothetical protein n=1 Tax=Anthocerotibacter panamensis TaxID=2857077 RepID=UPI001C40433C|nr:hypothetical protein [Anthocerotibacter panamensis]